MRSEARLPMHPPVSRYDQGARCGYDLDGFHDGLPGWALAALIAALFGAVCALVTLIPHGAL